MISGTILHYEIMEKLGEGGMGEVYKAHDTKLDRFVALKFLPSQLTATESESARFIQEAKAASALNHPNVCTIFDIQENQGRLFIVMEYVDGETLRDKRNLSVKQVVEIGAQAAEGLAAAHEKGIVHRDIKPENIMLTKSGVVKVMDFGLAKLNKAEEASRLTKAGTTLGTVGYMSPEQVQGQDVDHRSDIFSLGVVLYELLSGESPFKGVHETAIMYEIVNVDPEPVSAKKEGIDPELDRILFECLEKDREERYQSARELSKDLKRFKRDSGRQRLSQVSGVRQPMNSQSGRQVSGAYPAPPEIDETGPANGFVRNSRSLLILSAILLAGLAVSLVLYVLKSPARNRLEIKAAILPPPGMTLENKEGSNLTISPDGKYICFVAVDSTGNPKLWLRAVNSMNAVALATVRPDAYPFWSPDSKYIAYFTGGKLMKMSVGDRIAVSLCDASSGRGGTWNKKGMIVFSPGPSTGLYEVSSQGGEPREIIKRDGKVLSLRWPSFLPDGEHFLYSTQNSESGSSSRDGIFVGSLNGGTQKEILQVSSNAEYADGYLFYVSQSILLAEKFDPGSLTLSGDSRTLANNLQYYDIRISGTFSVSQAGMLVYEQKNPNNEKMVLFNRKGDIVKTLLDRKPFYWAEFSPNGRKVAFDYYDPSSRNIDIWTYDMARGVLTRLTFNKAADVYPRWTPDGKQISFGSERTGKSFGCYLKNADGSGTATLLCKLKAFVTVTDFSPDGKYALLTASSFEDQNSGADILLLPLTGDQKPKAYIATAFDEALATFSPDMKWVAYMSDESGRFQVYVSPFRNGGGKWQISVNGGSAPQWMDGGKELYFFTPDNKIMGVDINESGSSISPGDPHTVFKTATPVSRLLAVDDTGNEILADVPGGKSEPSPITLVANWKSELAKR